MLGLMQDRPLLISSVLEHAARNHGGAKIVSARPDGSLVRHTWPQVAARAAQLAHALAARGVQPGERIATLAWNEHRHLEIYYGVSSMGAVLHTVNPRLFPDQIAFILKDAADTHLFVDPTLLAGAEALADRLPDSLRTIVVMGTEADIPADCPLRGRFEVIAQESLLAGQPETLRLARARRALGLLALLYLRHHGRPEGRAVQPPLHRHPRAGRAAEGCLQHRRRGCGAAGRADVPRQCLGHPLCRGHGRRLARAARARGSTPPACIGCSRRSASPSPPACRPSGPRCCNWLRADPARRFANPPRLVVGGTALPTPINAGFLKEYGVQIRHAWGMTEISPLGSVNARLPQNADWDDDTLPRLCPQAGPRAVRDRAAGARRRRRARSRMTASPSASWRCAAPGWRSSTSTAPAIRPSPRMAGSAPATW